MKTIQMEAPKWKTAVTIYMGVLENPNAEESAKQCAREDILRLAETLDKINAERSQDNAS